MILVRFIPNILKDEGRTKVEIPYERHLTIEDYVRKANLPMVGNRLIVSGKANPHLKDTLKDGNEIIVTAQISDPVSAVVAAVNFVGAWVAANAVAASVLAVTVGYSIYQATQKPKLPSFNLPTGNFDDSSPTYGWDGIRTLQGEVNVPVAVGYGRHRLGGNVINQFVRTDGDKQYLFLLLALAEGEIESIDNIQLNDNPIGNFTSVEVVKRYGSNDQTPIPNFEELHQVSEVGAELTLSSPYTYTTLETALEAFEVAISLPLGIYYANSQGGIESNFVEFKIEYRETGSLDPWIEAGTYLISEKSRSKIVRIYRVEGLDPAQYDIRVTRLTEDSGFERVSDAMLDHIDEITLEDLAYPNTSLLAIKALANEQLSGSVPNVTAECKLKKVLIPDVRFGSTPVDWEDYYWDSGEDAFRRFSDDVILSWDGETYVAAWSANPVWCFKDMLINNRYGLGDEIDVTLLNDDQYLDMAKYAEERVQVVDENGSTYWEKRFRMDIVIDGLSGALDLLVQLSAVFRGMPFYGRGMVDLHIDKPNDPVQLFGMGNIIQDSFSQRWAAKKEKYNVIECSFLNKDRGYRQEMITVADDDALEAGEERRVKQLRLFTSYPSIALRESRYALAASKHVDRSLTFKAGIDAITCRIGQVIRFSHDVLQYGFSGRVKAGSTDAAINVDRVITIQPFKTYVIQVRFKDSDVVHERQVINTPGTYEILTVSHPFDTAPSEYDVYSFGEENVVTKQYRVMGIIRESNNETQIQALEYSTTVYEENPIELPATKYTALDLGIPKVTDLVLTERLTMLGDGTIENVIDVWWKKPNLTGFYVKQYTRANVFISDNGGLSWNFAGSTTGSYLSVLAGLQDGGTYKIAVAAVSEDGAQEEVATAPQATITLIGKAAKPSDVTSFIVVQTRDKIRMGWTDVTDVDLAGYEIRKGNSWDSGQVVVTNHRSNIFVDLDISEGLSDYWIKAIDTSGNYSNNAFKGTVLVTAIPFSNIVGSYAEETAWSATKVNMAEDDDQLVLNPGEESGSYTGPVRDLGFIAPFGIHLSALAVGSKGTTWESFSGMAWSDLSPSLRWGGQVLAGTLSFEIRTSEDGVTYTAWTPFLAGEHYCRYFQLRMNIQRPSPDVSVKIDYFRYSADLVVITETGSGTISNAALGLDVIFQKTFHQEPVASWNILSGSGIVAEITDKDTVGMNVKLKDASGAYQTGDVEFTLNGV